MTAALSRQVPDLQQVLNLLERGEPFTPAERFTEEVFSRAHQGIGDEDPHAANPDPVAHALHGHVTTPPDARDDTLLSAVVADCWLTAYQQAKDETPPEQPPAPDVIQQAVATATAAVKKATQPDALEVAALGHGTGPSTEAHAFRARAVKSTPAWRRAFLRVLGRMRVDTRHAPRGTPGLTGDSGRDLGARLRDVPHTELARARRDPRLWRAFLYALVNGAAPQVIREPVRSSDGPVVVLLDVSGSMAQHLDTAHAVACAVMTWARDRRRKAVLIPFETSPRAPMTLPEAMAWNARVRGGTDIAAAVHAAHEHIATAPGFRAADILLISDGDSAHVEVRHPRISTHGIAVIPQMVRPLEWWCAPRGTVTTLQDMEAGNTAAITQALRSHA